MTPRTGILGAMEVEVRAMAAAMSESRHEAAAGFDLWPGVLFGHDCVVARSGWGKVAASAAAQHLIDRWGVRRLVVCGLAGGLSPGLRLGDVVVGDAYVQHDLDASPIFRRYEIPGLGLTRLETPPALVEAAVGAAQAFLESGLNEAVSAETLGSFGIEAPRVHRGLIVTGDQFITDQRRETLRAEHPDALCVEMEGAALAQVCAQNDVPFIAVRIVSDNADRNAAVDFTRFVREVASPYALGIVRELLGRLP